jgi:CheY-like chemotaxis protein
MPGMGGLEVADQAQASTRTPVLFLSGYAPEQAEPTRLNRVGRAFFAKPFEPEALPRGSAATAGPGGWAVGEEGGCGSGAAGLQ